MKSDALELASLSNPSMQGVGIELGIGFYASCLLVRHTLKRSQRDVAALFEVTSSLRINSRNLFKNLSNFDRSSRR